MVLGGTRRLRYCVRAKKCYTLPMKAVKSLSLLFTAFFVTIVAVLALLNLTNTISTDQLGDGLVKAAFVVLILYVASVVVAILMADDKK